MKTGVNTGTIINVKNSPIIKKAANKSLNRSKRASICIECLYNEEGYCNRHNGWSGRKNHICLGIEDPYKSKVRKNTNSKKDNKANKKAEKKAAALSASEIEKLAKRYRIKWKQ